LLAAADKVVMTILYQLKRIANYVIYEVWQIGTLIPILSLIFSVIIFKALAL
jgi:hypothetical protein